MLKLRPCHVVLHCLFLRGSFQCFLPLTDALVQIRYAHPDLPLDSADHFFLRIRKLKEVLIHGIGTAAEYLYPLSLDQISGIASKYFGKVKHNTGLRFCKFVLLLFVELDHSQGDSGCFTELLLCQPSRLPCKL